MILFKYRNDTKEYIGYLEACLDPLETMIQGKKIYAYPPCTTEVAPPELREGYALLFNEEENTWEEVEDHRGQIVWDSLGNSFVIDILGELPKGYTLKRIPTLKEVKDKKIKEISEAYRSQCNLKVKVGNINASIEDAPRLSNSLTAFRKFGNFSYITEDEAVMINVAEAEEAIKFLYIRSILLPKRKSDLIKKVNNSKSIEEVNKITPDFKLNENKYMKISLEELPEALSK